MICLAAALGVLGIVAMGRAHRRCRGDHGYGYYGPFGDGHGWRGHGARGALRAMFATLDATAAQERAIVAELDRFTDRAGAAKASANDARADLAAAVRGPVIDDAALGAALGRIDAALGDVRAAGIDALRGIHGVLDDAQRTRLADVLGRGPRGRRGATPRPTPL